MRRVFFAASVAALLAASAVAQEVPKVFDAPLKDGKIIVEQRKNAAEIPSWASTTELKGMPMEPWSNQEVYLGRDASGKVTSFISVPRGTPITADAMFSSAPAGTVFTKVEGSVIADYLLPSDDQIQAAIENLLTTAQAKVCKMTTLPKTFEVAINIQAGAVVEGGVSLSATWETADLCKAHGGG